MPSFGVLAGGAGPRTRRQIPERSGLPSDVRENGAFKSGIPSGVPARLSAVASFPRNRPVRAVIVPPPCERMYRISGVRSAVPLEIRLMIVRLTSVLYSIVVSLTPGRNDPPQQPGAAPCV